MFNLICRFLNEEGVLVPTRYYNCLPGDKNYETHNIGFELQEIIEREQKVRIGLTYNPLEYVAKTPEHVKPEKVFENDAVLGIDEQVNFFLKGADAPCAIIYLVDVSSDRARFGLIHGNDFNSHRMEIYQLIVREKVKNREIDSS